MLFLPHIFVSFSCCLFFVLSLLLPMTHLPPISDQNSRFAEDYLINLYILPLKLDVGNKHIRNANEAEKCLPKCYEFPQWKGDGSMQHSTKSKETASSFWTVAPWSKLALFPAQSSLCEVKGSFFVQSFLQNSSSPLAVSGVGNAPQMVPWGLAKLGSEKEGRVSPLSFPLNILFFFFLFFHSFPGAQAAPVWVQGMSSPCCHPLLPCLVAAGRAVPCLGTCACHSIRRAGDLYHWAAYMGNPHHSKGTGNWKQAAGLPLSPECAVTPACPQGAAGTGAGLE